jgi:tryptophan synthase alpha chain
MKKRIDRRFQELKENGKKAFIAYITAGDPDLGATVEIAKELAAAGVDLIELGIPFSDPLADGRVNQAAAERALAAGTTWNGILRSVEQIRTAIDLPIIFFSYLNPLYAIGFDQALSSASAAGVDGMLLLDLPVEESEPFDRSFSAYGLDKICLITPTTPPERMERILAGASGFVYCVSRTGVTGAQTSIESGAGNVIAETRRHTSLPIALGFGISTPEQAASAAGMTDAVVVGSAIVQRFHDEPHTSEGRRAAAGWVADLVHAVKEI